MDPITKPFEQVSMDVAGPLPKTLKGNKYNLVMIDHLTRFVEIFPMPKIKLPKLLLGFLQHRL